MHFSYGIVRWIMHEIFGDQIECFRWSIKIPKILFFTLTYINDSKNMIAAKIHLRSQECAVSYTEMSSRHFCSNTLCRKLFLRCKDYRSLNAQHIKKLVAPASVINHLGSSSCERRRTEKNMIALHKWDLKPTLEIHSQRNRNASQRSLLK